MKGSLIDSSAVCNRNADSDNITDNALNRIEMIEWHPEATTTPSLSYIVSPGMVNDDGAKVVRCIAVLLHLFSN